MVPTSTRVPELTLPAPALTALREALQQEVGADAAATALRMAGFAAGEAFFRILAEADEDRLRTLPADRFWKDFGRLFSSRGWGQLTYEEAHPGVGSLHAGDWAESREMQAERPSCHFTTGLLSSLLGRVSGADVSVLEVECRGRGDGRCRFLFGGADAVFAVYERLATGEAPEAALQQIG
jgi:predicted hydrocarbon binding protein